MSSVAGHAAAALLALLATAGAADAQELQMRRERLQVLIARWRTAEAQEREADSIRSAGVKLDVFAAGPFRVTTEPGWSGWVAPHLTRALEPLREALGGDLAPLDGIELLLRPANRRPQYRPLWKSVLQTPSTVSALVQLDSAGIVAGLPEVLLRQSRNLLARRSGAVFTGWAAQSIPLPRDLDDAWHAGPLLEAAGIELATSPRAIVRRCYAGDLPACARSLGLGLAQESDPVLALYDPEDRRREVRRGRPVYGGEPEYGACVDFDHDSSCIAVLRRSAAHPPPLSPAARRSLLALAWEIGGPRALARLVADTTVSVGDRIALAAGLPLDSLLSEWRTRAFDNRPPAVAGTTRLRGAAVGWILAFVLFAVTSTRWRSR